MQNQLINIVIVEDIEPIRRGFTSYLEMQPEFHVMFSSTSVEDFLNESISPDPDVILCDIGLPGMSGIEGIRLFKHKWPLVEIIMITVFQDEENIYNAFCAGATGYLLKSTPISELKQGIINIMKGEVPMSMSVARKVLNHFKPKVNKIDDANLTPKEQLILESLVEGLSYKKISERANISLDTARSHIKNIYKKLHVNSKSEVMKIALDKKFEVE